MGRDFGIGSHYVGSLNPVTMFNSAFLICKDCSILFLNSLFVIGRERTSIDLLWQLAHSLGVEGEVWEPTVRACIKETHDYMYPNNTQKDFDLFYHEFGNSETSAITSNRATMSPRSSSRVV